MTDQDTKLTAQTDEGTTTVPPDQATTPPAAAKRPNKKPFQEVVVGQTYPGKVKSVVDYGAFVDIGYDRDGLVHISQLADTPTEKVADVVRPGQAVQVRVIDLDVNKGRISLSMRSGDHTADASAPTQPARPVRNRPEVDSAALAALSVGSNVTGTIKSTTAIGAFVDIGVGKDALVHISELAETRVAQVTDAVQVGQSYTFKIIEIDVTKARISLSLKQAVRSAQLNTLATGQVYTGTVSGHSSFGVFVNIGVGRDGLVHTSELIDAVKPAIGTELQVRVIDIDTIKNRISLTAILGERPAREERAPREDRAPREKRPAREERTPREERAPREKRQSEHYSTGGVEETTFEGDASIEDLASRFGGESRDKRARTSGRNSRSGVLPDAVIRRTLTGTDE
ncbi:MAG: S1 RNA-binding domain-containing protein [Roseiflexaceae bacterium]|jgi:small subunit ribosomal protein S1